MVGSLLGLGHPVIRNWSRVSENDNRRGLTRTFGRRATHRVSAGAVSISSDPAITPSPVQPRKTSTPSESLTIVAIVLACSA